MNSKESKFTSDAELFPKTDFLPTYIPEISASVFEANDSVYAVSDHFTKMTSHLKEKIGDLVEMTSPLDETIQQFTGITSCMGASLTTGITSCMETILESLTALQVEAPRLIGLSTIESLDITGFDIRSAIESLGVTGFDIGSTIESLCSTQAATSGLIDLSASTAFSSNLQNTIEFYFATQIETLSSTISTNLSLLNIFEVRNLALPQMELLKNQHAEPTYQQEIPIHPILKSEKVKKRDNLYDEIQLIVCDQHADGSLNIKAYGLLYNLEVSLRKLIKIKLIEPNRENLSNRIPKNILDSWKDKKQKEKTNSLEDDFDLIDYSDFTDLKTIFKMRKNYKLFNDIFTEEEMKILISKLHELNPIRIKIAHSRALTKNEVCRFILYSKDILTHISI